jgi:CO/xanthine dehydrogenase FAD-binding subunit
MRCGKWLNVSIVSRHRAIVLPNTIGLMVFFLDDLHPSSAHVGTALSVSNSYLRPTRLADALTARSQAGATIIAGGTDLYPAHVGKPLPSRLIDVTAIEEMRGIAVSAEEIRFGGAVTWTEIVEADLPPAFRALKEAARQIGSLQVQNRASLAGNLCNASPAADGAPPLLALEAEVELASSREVRRMPLEQFLMSYRRTALRADEILTAVIASTPNAAAKSAFVKLGARKYLVISIVMAAALVCRDASGRIAQANVAVGSASERAVRLRRLEGDLLGLARGRAPSAVLRAEHFEHLSPIDDVRAGAHYRFEAARHLVAMALDRATEG